MKNTESIDYIVELLLSIIELNDSILECIGSYDDKVIQRDVLLSIFEQISIPYLDDNELFALDILKEQMKESTEEAIEFITKRDTIKLIKP